MQKSVTLEKIIEINEAIKSIDGNQKIDSKTAYQLAKLFDKCKSYIQAYEKTRDTLFKKYSEEAKQLNPDNKELPEKDQADLKLKIAGINSKMNDELMTIVRTEETIDIYDFKFADFDGKEVPVKFFLLMGDIIQD